MTDPDDPKLLRELSRGEQARHVLDNPLLREALDTIRASLHAKFEASGAADREAREEIYRLLHISREFERHLVNVMETGKLAQKQREGLLALFRKRA